MFEQVYTTTVTVEELASVDRQVELELGNELARIDRIVAEVQIKNRLLKELLLAKVRDDLNPSHGTTMRVEEIERLQSFSGIVKYRFHVLQRS